MGAKEVIPLAPVSLDKIEAEKLRRIDKQAGMKRSYFKNKRLVCARLAPSA